MAIQKTCREAEGGSASLGADSNPESRYFASMGEMACILESSGKLIRANQAAVKRFAWPPLGREGVSILESIHPEDRSPIAHVISRMDAGSRARIVNRCRGQGGASCRIEWTLSVPPEGGSEIFAVLRDLPARSERECREEEEEQPSRIESILDTLPIQVGILDADGIVTYMNPAMKAFYGETRSMAPEDVAGFDYMGDLRRVLEKSADPCVERIHRGMEGVLAGSLQAFSQEVVCHDSARERWFLLSASILPAGIGGALVTHTELTAMKAIETDLRESEERFRQLSEASFEAVFLHQGGVILDHNDLAAGMFGSLPNGLIGPASAGKDGEFSRHLRDLLAPETKEPREATGRRRDGTLFPVELRGKSIVHKGRVVRVTAVRDLTRQRQIEEALEREQDKLKERECVLSAIFESMPHLLGVVALEGTDFRHVYFNGALLDYFGLASHQVSGRRAGELGVPEMGIREWVERFQESLEKDGVVRFDSLVGDRWFAGTVCPLRGDAEGQKRFAYVAEDITARKGLESELRKARDEATEADKAKSRFLSSMSHELRTPLNSIIGFTNVLLKNKAGNLAGQDLTYLDRVRSNGGHLLGLINDILDISKIEAGKMELTLQEVDLAALAASVLDQFEPQASTKGFPLVRNLPAKTRAVTCDPMKMKQALMNLVGNAIKFTEKGRVEVRLERHAESGLPLSLTVEDTGLGIAPDRMDRIFEAFSQADPTIAAKYGGTGLGLPITRSLLTLMGFGLDVKSVLGAGSSFTIRLEARKIRQPDTAPLSG